VARSTAKGSGRRRKPPADSAPMVMGEQADADVPVAGLAGETPDSDLHPRRNGGWREIEALREKAALKASLADVWDEDFDLDEEILAELDHTAEFFTTQEDPDEPLEDDDEDDEDFFEEEEEV